ncbi:AI-2E family transporter [Massilia oculi]|uniref:AI-2E family transporter n=1 Tax=Massilia oculi TaxID=945844 RepID=A0A2S2DM68_9BURK|nr:AI-2E family transporter [Massilia oculi]AWL06470.1 AI-2E family transporter [Massilia oculi]
MNAPYELDTRLEERLSRKLLDVFIRAGIVFGLALLSYRIFSPFLSLMAWSVILAVTLYPAHQKLAQRLRGKQGLAATLLVLVVVVAIGAPTAILMTSLGQSLQEAVDSVRAGTLRVPAPSPGVADWPLVGKRIHDVWLEASADLPALLRSRHAQVADLTRRALQAVAGIAGAMLLLLFSFIVAGIIMAWGRASANGIRAIFVRMAGIERGEEFVVLCTATIRAVALGVLGVALLQAIVVGLVFVVADVPFAGLLSLLVLVLGVVQVPALLATLPVIIYMWSSGDYGNTQAITYSVLLLLAGSLDNVLKPLLLGRGVNAPMPVILLGALGGLASAGLVGMFVGAVFLALSYQAFMWWVANSPDAVAPPAPAPVPAAPE